jgi:hypothetical protein
VTQEVTDYETQSIDLPFELITRLRELQAKAPTPTEGPKRAMQVLVSIDRDPGSIPGSAGSISAPTWSFFSIRATTAS